jgi:hypothetical protein
MIDRTIGDREHGMNLPVGGSAMRSESLLQPEEECSAEEVFAELQRVFGSPDFRVSPRNRRALEYLVHAKLEGRLHETRAYHIATQAYGRPASFDAANDPIVRIEMGALRRGLEVYYLKSGARNPLRISLPKGRYIVRVTRAPQLAGETAGLDSRTVTVLRAALCAWSGDHEGAVSAWNDLKSADPLWPADLHNCATSALRDDKVVRLVVEGALRAGRWADTGAESAAG